ncbi:molybdate transport system ATP-binding protein [Kineococcus radiotolerans]|uniref:Molybdate transport system ATP-binding protein n=1 Tax=Kineococcus radiotolerans TaxID=131568 RepID=A0A7W4XY18_KINRA|nr:ABC transporter ATP-binding protein [Kineococcus radiotolerans]MBB2902523.1 molybdate transport system ATP-binding protein [Kineococcus radiotolerans]
MNPAANPAVDPAGGVLEVDVRFAERDLALELSLAPGEVLAVLGPNGAGKSTLLGLLAGSLRPSGGRVVLDGEVLADDRGTFVPPHRRGVGLLAQDALLFPHLDVEANVAFGPRSAGVPRARARERARRVLADVGADRFARRRPHELSGGQAQRVALARALAADPRLLLLDEPLAALDVAAAPEVRQVLRRVLRGGGGGGRRSAVLVTHDPLDALALADAVVVLEAGRVVERGPAQQVLAAPRSAFGARLAGLVLLPGTTTADGLRTAGGTVVHGPVRGAAGERGVALFSPAAVSVHAADPGGRARNRWPATVLDVLPRGEVVRLRARPDVLPGHDVLADVPVAAAAALDLAPGARVHLVVEEAAVGVHVAGPPTGPPSAPGESDDRRTRPVPGFP